MGKRLVISLVLLTAVTLQLTAQSGYSNLEFIENKGQWDQRLNFRAQISAGAFFLQKKGFTVLLQNSNDLKRIQEISHGHTGSAGIGRSVKINSNQPGSANSNENNILHSHVYQVSFLGADEKMEIVPDKPLPTYNNYFIGNDPSKWASHCKIFQGITYKNIYPHIDVRYYSYNGQLKYDIIVHPGGDPDKIAMKYEGHDKLTIHNNQLIIKTSVGDAKELEPHSYQLMKTDRSDVECKYILAANNTVKFKIKNYSPDATLIIDPTLVFVTFTGSTSDNWGYTATYDATGNFYSGSIVLDDIQGDRGNGFPASTGAYQTSFQGGDHNGESGYAYDIAIMKFNSNGSNRMYATYLGGEGNEQPHSLIVDNSGNLIIAGRTNSANFPVTSPTFGPGGGFDIFIAKLNVDGTKLVASRKFGGTGDDGVNIAPKYSTVVDRGTKSLRLNYGDDGRSEVIIDGSDNIYVASCTRPLAGSLPDFPTVNAFQPGPGGGEQDGVVIKANPDLSNVLFSSYIGGSRDDAAFVLALNPINNNIYVGGGTASNDLKGTGNGPVLFNSLVGGIDGFVSIISNDGTRLITTSYFGTTGREVIYGIQFDKKGFPYITGTTTGNWPVTPAGIFSQAKGKQFIAKLKPDLSGWVYSTVFGTGAIFPDISPTAFLVDKCENVYVAGWGGGIDKDENYDNNGTQGLSVTPNAIKSTTDGADFYFFVLQKNAASQLYGSFFGQDGGVIGEHVDGGTSRFDKEGVVYEAVCANCYGKALFPTTPGVWASTNGAGTSGCNLAAVKIAFNFAGVAAGLKSTINGRYDSSGCVPLDVTLFDTIRNAKSYIWKFGDGTPDLATTSFQVNHTYNSVGAFLVQLIAIDSNSCNVSDTVHITILVRNDKAALAFDEFKLLPCESLAFQFVNLSSAPAGKPFTNNSFIWDFGDGTDPVPSGPSNITHSFASAGTYIVKLILADTNYCNYPDTVSKTLRIASLVKAQFETPAAGCAPYTAVFNNTSVAGQQFDWDFGDGSSSTDFNPTHLYANTGSFTITLKVTDPNTCNITDSYQFTITVNAKPQAAFTDEPIPPQANKPTIFNNNSVGAIHFKWFFGDGDSAIKATMDTVMHQYRKTGTFQACLVAYNQFECTDTFCLPVETLVNPLLDVPNAFTPGRFGQNGIVKVQGFGIATMTFRIYNRWGQKVFETNNPNQGWDGIYKGILQPMDAYAYIVEAVFFDGTKTTKKGDITLIR